jgi:hypothetical protein
MRSVCNLLLENFEGRRIIGKPMRILEDYIKVDLKRGVNMDWIDMNQSRGQ